jgi:hypothetical protein
MGRGSAWAGVRVRVITAIASFSSVHAASKLTAKESASIPTSAKVSTEATSVPKAPYAESTCQR